MTELDHAIDELKDAFNHRWLRLFIRDGKTTHPNQERALFELGWIANRRGKVDVTESGLAEAERLGYL